MSMKGLKPSSIQASRRSLKPTTIGNHVCPISCAVTQKSGPPLSLMPSNSTPGYSIPDENPATLIAFGYGYGYQRAEKCSTASFRYSVDRPHAASPADSIG